MSRCVIFDLDGTLADTSGDLIAAANACFAGMGLSVRLDPAKDAGIAVRGGKSMLTAGLTRAGVMSQEVVDRWYQPLLEHYSGALAEHTVMYDGAVAEIEALRRSGYVVGICTNKPEALAERLMQALGVRDLFGSLIGADTLPTRKPDVAPYWAAVDRCGGTRAASVMVGDTETDRNTAAAARVPCILVTFASEGEAVRDLCPDGVIGHFRELPAEVTRLIG